MPIWKMVKIPLLVALAFVLGAFVSLLTIFASQEAPSAAGSGSRAAGVLSSRARVQLHSVAASAGARPSGQGLRRRLCRRELSHSCVSIAAFENL
jgi:hypothetical protein